VITKVRCWYPEDYLGLYNDDDDANDGDNDDDNDDYDYDDDNDDNNDEVITEMRCWNH
jgi:hypothetical protein